MKGYFTKENFEEFKKWKVGNNRYEVRGGPTISTGEMFCRIVIMMPYPDKRFKSGFRYYEYKEIPVITRGMPSPTLNKDDIAYLSNDMLEMEI